MSDEHDEDPELLQALARLPKQVPAPPDLEGRTVRYLRQSGALGARSGRARWALRVAAALVLLGLGYLWGHATAQPEAARGPRYVILLRNDKSFAVPEGGEASLVAEYRNWAVRLRSSHRLLSGEELDPSQTLLPSSPPGISADAPISGFFLIAASNDTEALQIATTCPHLRHGGRIEVRRIRPT